MLLLPALPDDTGVRPVLTRHPAAGRMLVASRRARAEKHAPPRAKDEPAIIDGSSGRRVE
jgi:hypothetical protein